MHREPQTMLPKCGGEGSRSKSAGAVLQVSRDVISADLMDGFAMHKAMGLFRRISGI